ncbi:unnamed protein product [Ectocarpus sp. CCAP 1310/34]|nr:unnamed protein product [Ectocarpus sp. CCAP 1310/34]
MNDEIGPIEIGVLLEPGEDVGLAALELGAVAGRVPAEVLGDPEEFPEKQANSVGPGRRGARHAVLDEDFHDANEGVEMHVERACHRRYPRGVRRRERRDVDGAEGKQRVQVRVRVDHVPNDVV